MLAGEGGVMGIDLSNVGKAGLVRAPGSTTAKPAIIEHASMLFLGNHKLFSDRVAYPQLQGAAVTLAPSSHHQRALTYTL